MQSAATASVVETGKVPLPGPPLCIDLDGTLIKTDLLWETLVALLRRHPWQALWLPFWLLAGRANLKRQLAQRVQLDCASLPYTTELVEYLRQAYAAGRELVLVSACDHLVGSQVAKHLGLFREVIASDGRTNLKGRTKAQLLQDRFGARGYDYAGNERADLPVWEGARERLVANAHPRILRYFDRQMQTVRAFSPQRGRLAALLRALRCHQWTKNLLVFLPLIAAHAFQNQTALAGTLIIFLAWCVVSSGIYVCNDLLDLEADRHHPTKRLRPFANGDLPLAVGVFLGPALLLGGFLIGATLSIRCGAVLLLYACVACAYSFHLKKRPLVDVFALAFLFTIRVVGGGLASGFQVSSWLLAFSGFLFLGLAFLKRCSELVRIQGLGRKHLGSRGYGVVDLVVLQMFGVASAFMAILVLALYLNSPAAQAEYRWPAALWALGPLLLLWLCRLWLATARGEMNDDPIVYSFGDWVSWLLGLSVVAVYWMATRGMA